VPVSPKLALVGFIGLCLLVAAVDGSMTARAIQHWYRTLHAPFGTPPAWLFAPVWSVLYVLIGTAAWLVWRRLGAAPSLRLWGWQLAANALWAPAFFAVHSPALAMGVIVVLLFLIGLTIRAFRRIHRVAAMLMVPYGVWCLYAAYLNLGFLILNPA
jgi:tryptophan-rich sensory protein